MIEVKNRTKRLTVEPNGKGFDIAYPNSITAEISERDGKYDVHMMDGLSYRDKFSKLEIETVEESYEYIEKTAIPKMYKKRGITEIINLEEISDITRHAGSLSFIKLEDLVLDTDFDSEIVLGISFQGNWNSELTMLTYSSIKVFEIGRDKDAAYVGEITWGKLKRTGFSSNDIVDADCESGDMSEAFLCMRDILDEGRIKIPKDLFYLSSLNTDLAFRGKGYGKLLVNLFMEYIAERETYTSDFGVFFTLPYGKQEKENLHNIYNHCFSDEKILVEDEEFFLIENTKEK